MNPAWTDQRSQFRDRLFGFLLGCTLTGAGIYSYVLREYKESNEMLAEDIYVRCRCLFPNRSRALPTGFRVALSWQVFRPTNSYTISDLAIIGTEAAHICPSTGRQRRLQSEEVVSWPRFEWKLCSLYPIYCSEGLNGIIEDVHIAVPN
jgi:hypothetical protein